MEFLIRLSAVILLLVLFTAAEPQSAANHGVEMSPPTVGIDCGAACGVRCGKSSRPNLCKRACGTCCARCRCVPPGTYGNYEACPCYGAITTRRAQRKCP